MKQSVVKVTQAAAPDHLVTAAEIIPWSLERLRRERIIDIRRHIKAVTDPCGTVSIAIQSNVIGDRLDATESRSAGVVGVIVLVIAVTN